MMVFAQLHLIIPSMENNTYTVSQQNVSETTTLDRPKCLWPVFTVLIEDITEHTLSVISLHISDASFYITIEGLATQA